MPLDINKIVEEVIQEMEEATTMITTPTGDTSSATSDQKKKIKMSSDKGEDVKIVKKGETIKESFDWGTLIASMAPILGMGALALSNEFRNKKTNKERVKHLKSLYDKADDNKKKQIDDLIKKLQSKAPQKYKDYHFNGLMSTVEKESNINESITEQEFSTSQKVSAAIDEAISTLSGLSESDDKKAKRYSEQVIGYLNKAKTALEALTGHETKLSEQAAAQQAKAGEKQIKAIEKALSKTVKNPDLVARIMKKVPVTKAIELQKKAGKDLDPAKVAEAILKVSLKEAYMK